MLQNISNDVNDSTLSAKVNCNKLNYKKFIESMKSEIVIKSKRAKMY
jgi:hypothetical protein